MQNATTAVPSIPLGPRALPPRIAWVEPTQSFLILSLFNGLLRILTLGLYHFWGKTEVRQRIWSAVRIDGEPLEYRGTGGELLRGFLIVFGLILLPMGLAGFVIPLLLRGSAAAEGGYQSLIWLLLLVLSGVGMHRARRYRLSRTCFRGIRGGLAGKSAPFAWTYLWTIALVPFTLGWIYPYRALVLYRKLTNDSRFGDATFEFSGRSSALYRRFWVVWLGGVILVVVALGAIGALLGPGGTATAKTLSAAKIASAIGILAVAYFLFGLIYSWYAAGRLNYFAAHTRLAGTTFKLRATVPSLLWLTATNTLLRLLSLGFLSPVAEARSMRYIVERLTIEGPIEWARIAQNPDALLKRGEGLAEAFNVDAF